jgi:hypothetical protein
MGAGHLGDRPTYDLDQQALIEPTMTMNRMPVLSVFMELYLIKKNHNMCMSSIYIVDLWFSFDHLLSVCSTAT